MARVSFPRVVSMSSDSHPSWVIAKTPSLFARETWTHALGLSAFLTIIQIRFSEPSNAIVMSTGLGGGQHTFLDGCFYFAAVDFHGKFVEIHAINPSLNYRLVFSRRFARKKTGEVM
jgi:hypothetical protein